LLRCESEHGQQFNHDFDDHVNHWGCELDLNINLYKTREMFDTIESFDNGIVAFHHVFGRLADAYTIIG
jgi:hypothetical protein